MNEESSEHILPTSHRGSEITFAFPRQDAFIPFKLRLDALEDLEQYGVELEIMKNGERKLVGSFGICLEDIESQHFQKTKLRKINSQMKSFQTIEIKYKVFEGKPQTPVTNTSIIQVTESLVPEEEDTTDDKNEISLVVKKFPTVTENTRPNFRKNSCIVVLGTTGRGKTTTMNIFTGNNEPTGNTSHSTTRCNRLYGDMLPQHQVSQEGVGYPVWLDTVGLDESDADVTNGDLVRSYLRVLQCFKIEWVHAVVWCITPEDKVDNKKR